jgi:hypothetical protein
MRTLITYPLATGGRAIVLVPVREEEYPFMLLDVPADGPLDAGADCRIIDTKLTSDGEAWAVALAHMLRTEHRGEPAPAAA